MAFEEENTGTYNHLQELSSSDFEIKDGEPDIIGWSVFNTEGDKIGEVDDLLFDPEARKVRYIVLELQANGEDVLDDDHHVLIPIGVAELFPNDDNVVLPIASAQQLSDLPIYETGKLSPDAEMRIREVFEGSSGSTAPYEHPQFYQHQHFDEDRFYNPRPPVVTDTELTDVTEEDPEDEAARALKVSRIIQKINNKP